MNSMDEKKDLAALEVTESFNKVDFSRLQESIAIFNDIQIKIWESKKSFYEKLFISGMCRQLRKVVEMMLVKPPERNVNITLISAIFGIFFYIFIEFTRRGKLLSLIFTILKVGFEESFGKTLVTNAPGSWLLSLVSILYSRRTVEETFKPMVGLWREDYYHALKEGNKLKARVVSIRETFNFMRAMCSRSPLGELFEVFLRLGK